MAMFNFKHAMLTPFASTYRAKKREERMNKKNIRLIREFLNIQKLQQENNNKELAHLKQQRKSRSIDKLTYERLRKVLVLSHEMDQLEILDSVTSKSAKRDN